MKSAQITIRIYNSTNLKHMLIKYLHKYVCIHIFNNRNVCDYDKMFLMYATLFN